ncbi:hypothetical protein ACJ73_03903 [Blastomyces percursus]|uniref:HTH CENPB-type domain-containing protein n=1 Tax=Blastomyces percursus TaxID=1658174 RepID=A0A1J9Q8D5_9EURO|nr:hypothetical protein ACJ73_03903 [Blastomyces percursus]
MSVITADINTRDAPQSSLRLFWSTIAHVVYASSTLTVIKAIDALESNPNLHIKPVAREFNIPYSTLYGRVKGRKSRICRVPIHRALNDSQEEAIKKWIHQLDVNFCSPTIEHIEAAANRMLQGHHTDPETPPPTASKMWAYRFIKRLPDEYNRVKQKPMDPKRISSEDISFIINWFDRYESILNQYNFHATDIYNFDEIGFQRRRGTRAVVLECVSADGTVLYPLIVMRSKVHLEDWYINTNLSNNYAIATSESGFTNDEIAFDWIKRFDTMSKKRQMGSHRLLLLDNHGSHLTEEFLQYCYLHKIIIFGFSSHTSHYSTTSRWSGFADRGIYPVNRDVILDRLRSRTLQDGPDLVVYDGDGDECFRFTPPPANRPSTTSSDLTSPDTVAKLRRQIDAAEKAIQDAFENKIFKGSMIQAGLNARREGELSAHYRANRRRVVKTTRRQVQVWGVLTVNNANRKIANRKAEESKKEHNRMLRSIGIKSTKSTADQPQRTP